VDEFSPHSGARRYVAAWLLIAAALSVALTTWGTALTGVMNSTTPAPRVTTGSSLDGGALFQAPSTPAESCQFVQNGDGTVVVMSAKTGSLLSEAQAANCTK
jgi:hypothetical protein